MRVRAHPGARMRARTRKQAQRATGTRCTGCPYVPVSDSATFLLTAPAVDLPAATRGRGAGMSRHRPPLPPPPRPPRRVMRTHPITVPTSVPASGGRMHTARRRSGAAPSRRPALVRAPARAACCWPGAMHTAATHAAIRARPTHPARPARCPLATVTDPSAFPPRCMLSSMLVPPQVRAQKKPCTP